jgi:hypothetical protein
VGRDSPEDQLESCRIVRNCMLNADGGQGSHMHQTRVSVCLFAAQFMMTVMGVMPTCSTAVLTRKRSPSVTSC